MERDPYPLSPYQKAIERLMHAFFAVVLLGITLKILLF